MGAPAKQKKPKKLPTSVKVNWTAPVLSIVVPTFNESENIAPLIEKISTAMGKTPWEMIVVDDDSPDGTAEITKALSRQYPHIRCIKRVGRRGLSSACVEGISASAAPFVAVMDADHQHDETILPKMLAEAQAGKDLVVASRYVGDGSATGGFTGIRLWGSQLATRLSGLITGYATTDPMSGFFLMRRDLFDDVAARLAPDGFKILLDIIVSASKQSQQISIAEVPYAFRERYAGESKMSSIVAVQFVGLWLSKLTNGLLPASFLMFAMVGLSGVVVHMAALWVFHMVLTTNFAIGQLLATLVAMSWNFFLNNVLTYADKRLRGRALWLGLLSFYVVCSFGTVANVSVASVIYEVNQAPLIAGLAGALMSSVFNYAVTRIFTWR